MSNETGRPTPRGFKPGRVISAKSLNDLQERLPRRIIGDGKTIRTRTLNNQVVIEAIPNKSGGSTRNGGHFRARAAVDIGVDGEGLIDLIDKANEETGESINALNEHTQFRIGAGWKIGGPIIDGVYYIWWADRCPEDVEEPPERCYCAPPAEEYGSYNGIMEYDCEVGLPEECASDPNDPDGDPPEMCSCEDVTTGNSIAYQCAHGYLPPQCTSIGG